MPFELCYITDRHDLKPGALLPRILDAVRAGVDLVQVREKDLETRALVELVKSALESARGTNTRIVVNDRLDVALALAADGVHLGRQSIPAEVVRAQVPPDFLVGVSCHSLEEALAAHAARADYLHLGPIFETPSKISYGPPLGLSKLREVTARVKVPVLALGGISVERVKPCLEAGAAGVAGIRVFQDCESVEDRVRELRAQFDR
jgi:thiamine-phosphate pyrophosphorylase